MAKQYAQTGHIKACLMNIAKIMTIFLFDKTEPADALAQIMVRIGKLEKEFKID